jgi:hypothetical protein
MERWRIEFLMCRVGEQYPAFALASLGLSDRMRRIPLRMMRADRWKV